MVILVWLLGGLLCAVLAACAVFNQPRFGSLPEGERLDRIKQAHNYRDGEFQYPVATPLFSQDAGMLSVLWHNLVNKNDRLVPDAPLPAVKTNLKALDKREDVVVWLGHSSWFIQLGGKSMLIDPVLSDYAAPFSFVNKAFPGTSIYTAEDMPEIDALLISHDHWDHLDYATVKALQSKVAQVICPLGVGGYFESWGFAKGMIYEGNWLDQVEVTGALAVYVLPARHYSGRMLAKNKKLWAGFALESADRKIFYSGDSGYGPHFAEIGQAFSGFDLVLLDCGQYDPRWSYLHMTPEEAAMAADDLKARAFLPAHVGRFTIANHAWDEPFQRLTEAGIKGSFQLVAPIIGEPVAVDSPSSQFAEWWLLKELRN